MAVMLSLGAMKRLTLLPSLLWICLVARLVYPTLTLNTILPNIFCPVGWEDDWNGAVANKLHSIKPVLGRLAVLLQAVQEGWSSLVPCQYRSYTSDTFIYLAQKPSTSVWALSVYSDSATHFGGVQSFCWKNRMYLVRKMWWNYLDSIPRSFCYI